MKKEEKIYRCSECDETITYIEGQEVPICCGKRMTLLPLEPCTTAQQAEMARNYDDDDACDDASGKK